MRRRTTRGTRAEARADADAALPGEHDGAGGTPGRIDDATTQHVATPLQPNGDELPPMPPGHGLLGKVRRLLGAR